MRLRIILVDDDRMSLKSMYLFLATEYDVDCFSDPHTALKHIQEGAGYNMIISDFKMPGLNGLELISGVRQHLPEIKTILCTGCDTEKLRQTALDVQVEHFLSKPINIEELIQVINR